MSAEARTLTEKNGQELADWCGGILVAEHDALDHSKTYPGINLPLETGGVGRASVGDTIIKTNTGGFTISWKAP